MKILVFQFVPMENGQVILIINATLVQVLVEHVQDHHHLNVLLALKANIYIKEYA